MTIFIIGALAIAMACIMPWFFGLMLIVLAIKFVISLFVDTSSQVNTGYGYNYNYGVNNNYNSYDTDDDYTYYETPDTAYDYFSEEVNDDAYNPYAPFDSMEEFCIMCDDYENEQSYY